MTAQEGKMPASIRPIQVETAARYLTEWNVSACEIAWYLGHPIQAGEVIDNVIERACRHPIVGFVERIALIIDIARFMAYILPQWLDEPHQALGGKTPRSCLLGEPDEFELFRSEFYNDRQVVLA